MDYPKERIEGVLLKLGFAQREDSWITNSYHIHLKDTFWITVRIDHVGDDHRIGITSFSDPNIPEGIIPHTLKISFPLNQNTDPCEWIKKTNVKDMSDRDYLDFISFTKSIKKLRDIILKELE